MLFGSALCFLILALPVEIQTIVSDLGSSDYKIRKLALVSAKNLSSENKRVLINELKKSEDPELSETAKELTLYLPEALNKKFILNNLLDKNYENIEKALKIKPSLFNNDITKGYNAFDLALMMDMKKFIILFKNAGLRSSKNSSMLMDVLVVESDTWESLGRDFNCSAQLIMIINKNHLKLGAVIKVPRSK